MVGTTKRAPGKQREAGTVTAWTPARRRFTTDEYDRMIEAGILPEDEHIELIDGEIVLMAALGSKHAGCVSWLLEWLIPNLAGRATVRAQDPVHLSTGSEPEPDVALLRQRADRYRSAHPVPDDILLLIEVADTSLPYDSTVKQQLYAQAGIAEFWIVDLAHEQVLVHRGPHEGQYTKLATAARGGTVAPLAFPELSAAVSEILG